MPDSKLFLKQSLFFMYRKRPSLKAWRGCFLLHKNLWIWLSPSWEYFLRPLAAKRSVSEQDLLSTWSAHKLKEFVILWWILKNACLCDKNWISWGSLISVFSSILKISDGSIFLFRRKLKIHPTIWLQIPPLHLPSLFFEILNSVKNVD